MPFNEGGFRSVEFIRYWEDFDQKSFRLIAYLLNKRFCNVDTQPGFVEIYHNLQFEINLTSLHDQKTLDTLFDQ